MSMEWIAMPMVTHPQLRPKNASLWSWPRLWGEQSQIFLLNQILQMPGGSVDSALAQCVTAIWVIFTGIRIDTYIGDWVPLFFSDRNKKNIFWGWILCLEWWALLFRIVQCANVCSLLSPHCHNSTSRPQQQIESTEIDCDKGLHWRFPGPSELNSYKGCVLCQITLR